MQNSKGTLSVKELAAYLNIGMNAAYELVWRPDFPALRIAKRIVIPMDLLSEWLRLNAKKPIVW